ncbi:hypothetical protein ACWDGI_05105 [Streptomyces sp. NPDC001220]
MEIVDEAGHSTRFTWSPEGKLLRRAAADGAAETWTYDGEGNCTSHTDRSGHLSRFEYTHFDLLTARIAPDGTRHEFAYDSSLRLTGVVNPLGMTWSYAYDQADRLVSETDFDGRTVTYTHHSAAFSRSVLRPGIRAPNPMAYVTNPDTWSDHLGLSPEECTQSIFKAPGRKLGEQQEKYGYREADFPGDPDAPDYSYPNGRVHFAKERHVAEKYAKSYGEGVIEIKIPKSEYAAKYEKYERNYEGGPEKELEIPNNVVEDLNQYPRVRHR